MKLKNKTTGEIVSLEGELTYDDKVRLLKHYNSLAELCEEWEDYDDTKDHWCISFYGELKQICNYATSEHIAGCKQICNYFETKEEAEKAVRKLQAWKRLKDKGFEFTSWKGDEIEFVNECPNVVEDIEEFEKDLDLLFGGEE